MATQEKLFNTRKRRVFRSRIGAGELAFGVIFVVLVIAMCVWIFVQRDNYDPSERDITMSLMEEGSVEDTLYRTPLARWQDPAQAAAHGGAATVDLGIFPTATLEGGWTPSTRVQVFDDSNVYEKINGAAPQYQSFGFKNLHFVGIQHPTEPLEINIEVYDQGAFENALGIFSAQRDADRAVEQQGQVYFYRTTVGAIGMVDRFYFKFTGTAEGPATEEKTTQLLRAFATHPEGESVPPKAFLVLRDVLEVPFEGIAFEKSDVFQYQFAQNFWFGVPDIQADLRYYIHEASDEAAAIELFDLLLENHLFDYDEVERTDDTVILKHKFLDTRLAMKRTGALLFGFDGAPPELNAQEVLGTLQEAFASDEEEV